MVYLEESRTFKKEFIPNDPIIQILETSPKDTSEVSTCT